MSLNPIDGWHLPGMAKPSFDMVGKTAQAVGSGTAVGPDVVQQLAPRTMQGLFVPSIGLPSEDLDGNQIITDLDTFGTWAGWMPASVPGDSSQSANDRAFLGLALGEWDALGTALSSALDHEEDWTLASTGTAGRSVTDLVFATLCATAMTSGDPKRRNDNASTRNS